MTRIRAVMWMLLLVNCSVWGAVACRQPVGVATADPDLTRGNTELSVRRDGLR